MGEPSFLTAVRDRKKKLLEINMKACSLEEIKKSVEKAPPLRSFKKALLHRGPAIIGEVKRRSPSADMIRYIADPAEVARDLQDGGAAAVSVLTEERSFGGSLDDLRLVREHIALPVLRKDFLIHPYDLYQARSFGADAVLLIVGLLSESSLSEMMQEAGRIGMDCLVEVHDEHELSIALDAGADCIGINNRNLRTLEVDMSTAISLAPLVPSDRVAVAESGYRTPDDIDEAMKAGISAFLIGEALMRNADVKTAVREFASACRLPGNHRGHAIEEDSL